MTSTHFTERLVSALIELQGRDLKYSLALSSTTLTQRIDSILVGLLKQTDPVAAEKIRAKVREELSDSFRSMEFQSASVARLPDPESLEPSRGSVVAPGVPRLIIWVAKNETKFSFLSVKFLREKVFGSDPAVQEALQFCIDRGILQTYDQPNPKNPSWPTTACRLNHNHPVVQEVLQGEGNAET